MNDVTVIDRYLNTFSRYIDSGFGLLQGEVAFLTATLIVIDMTLAADCGSLVGVSAQVARMIRMVLVPVVCPSAPTRPMGCASGGACGAGIMLPR